MAVRVGIENRNRAGLFALLVFCSLNYFGQNLEGSHWYWGPQGIGLKFDPFPAPNTNGVLAGDMLRATISDESGNLILYSNGNELRNGEHLTVLNSTSSLSNISTVGKSLLTKLPQSDSLYLYSFTASTTANIASSYYSIIDITANNDTGAVIPNSKEISILDSVSIKISILEHINGEDFWLIFHSYEGNTFYSFLVDSSGVDTSPVVTTVGTPYYPSTLSSDGYMKSSPNSKYIALLKNNGMGLQNGFLELFKFNQLTGQPDDPIIIPLHNRINMALKTFSFSPNSRKLYLPYGIGTSSTSGIPDTSYLYQFDCSIWDSTALNLSKSIIDTAINIFYSNNPHILEMQIGVDGNIYTLHEWGGLPLNKLGGSIGKISCPNLNYTEVNYDNQHLFILNSTSNTLPTLNQTLFVNANILQAQSQSGDVCNGDTAQLIAYGAGADRFIWTMEDGSPANTLSDDTLANPKAWPDSTTTYRVIGMSSSCSSADGEDTAFVTVRVGNGPEEPLFPDTVSRCVNDTFTANLPAQTPFWWSTGADTHVVQLTQSDTYRYVYADSLGCASDTFSFTLQFFDSAVVELDADSQLCELEEGQANVISQTAVNWTTTAEILESDSFFIRYRAQNPFWLRAAPQDSNACAVSDSVFVTVIPTPDAGTDFDTVLCLPDSFPFIPNAPQLSPLRFVRESTGDTLRAADWPKMLFAEGVLTERFIAFNPQNCSDTIHVNAELLLPQTEPEGNFEILRDCEKAVLRIFPQTGVAWYLNGNEMPLEDIRVSDGDSFLIAEYDESRRCLRTTKLVIGEGSAALGVELPNVFTPNGDGVNDIFEPVGPVNHVCGTLQVYNRWGNLIHETREGAGISWNGRNFSGEPVPEGTYFYVFTSGDEVVKGSVQVLR